jgi:hypothetical protein
MKIRVTKAQRQRISALSAEVVKAQRVAVEALAAELERRRQKEPPFEWDDSVLAELANAPLPAFDFEDVNLDSLCADLPDLSTLFDQPPGTPGTPVYIPISDD